MEIKFGKSNTLVFINKVLSPPPHTATPPFLCEFTGAFGFCSVFFDGTLAVCENCRVVLGESLEVFHISPLPTAQTISTTKIATHIFSHFENRTVIECEGAVVSVLHALLQAEVFSFPTHDLILLSSSFHICCLQYANGEYTNILSLAKTSHHFEEATQTLTLLYAPPSCEKLEFRGEIPLTFPQNQERFYTHHAKKAEGNFSPATLATAFFQSACTACLAGLRKPEIISPFLHASLAGFEAGIFEYLAGWHSPQQISTSRVVLQKQTSQNVAEKSVFEIDTQESKICNLQKVGWQA